MDDKVWLQLQERHDSLVKKLAEQGLDNNSRRIVQKDASRLSMLLDKNKKIQELTLKINEAREQSQRNTDPELAALYQEEVEQLARDKSAAHSELDDIMFPPDPRDNKSVYLEIRAGTGGQEAALFAGDLLRMYTNYALRNGWRATIEDSSPTDLGGFKEVIVHIEGNDVWGCLKHESGVHRVQRVPLTETSGRIHTSTATVAVLPEADDVEVIIDPSDLRIDTYRSGGAGGQHVNRTDSAVRITHIPTGVVVACQDERSQHKNRAKAMKILQARILAAQTARQQLERSETRKEQVGTGERAEKVRTYNFPQNRITDHQVDVTLKNLDVAIKGEIDPIINALREKEREDRKKKPIF